MWNNNKFQLSGYGLSRLWFFDGCEANRPDDSLETLKNIMKSI